MNFSLWHFRHDSLVMLYSLCINASILSRAARKNRKTKFSPNLGFMKLERPNKVFNVVMHPKLCNYSVKSFSILKWNKFLPNSFHCSARRSFIWLWKVQRKWTKWKCMSTTTKKKESKKKSKINRPDDENSYLKFFASFHRNLRNV